MNLREAELHLRALFEDIINDYKGFIEIRVIGKDRSKCFFFPSIEDAVSWLEFNSPQLKHYNTYVGVNLRCSKPKKGCGASKHVTVAQFLFADKDFKEEVDPPEEIKQIIDKEGYYKGDGYVIAKCTNKEGKVKYEKITKPRLYEFEKWLEGKLKPLGVELDHILIIDSGNGYHVYIKINPVSAKLWREIQALFVKYMEADRKTKDPSRILRLAGTINNRYDAYTTLAEIARYPSEFKEYDALEIYNKLKEIVGSQKEVKKVEVKSTRGSISKDKITQLIEILKPYYVVGYRHNICLFLAGLLRKLGYSIKEVKDIISTIAQAFNDEEIEDRLKAVETTFEKDLEDVAGKSYLEEVFEEFFVERGLDEEEARDRALEVVSRVKNILEASDINIYTIVSIYQKVDKNGHKVTGHRAIVNDSKRGILIVNTWSNPRRLKVFDYYIQDLTVYTNPHDPKDKVFTVVFANPRGGFIRFEEVKLNDLVNMLKNIEGVYNYSKLHDCLSALFNEFIKRGIAKVKPRVPATGFFEVEGELRWFESPRFKVTLPKPDAEKTKEALKVLEELLKFYRFSDKALANIYFGVQAPLGFIRKLYARESKILFNYGEPHVGKTLVCKIVCAIWGVPESAGIVAASSITQPQVADRLDKTTLPITFDEVRNMLSNPAIADILKNATTNIHIKSRILPQMGYTTIDFHAYASIIMTTNFVPQLYIGLEERIIPIEWTVEDKRSESEVKEFLEKLQNNRELLAYIGSALRALFTSMYDDIKEIILTNDELTAGRKILEKLYEVLGLDKPEWLKDIEVKFELEQVSDEEIFFGFLRSEILESARKVGIHFIGDDWKDEEVFIQTIQDIARTGGLPYYLKVGRDNLYVSPAVIVELQRKLNYEVAGGLKNLAMRLGYSYRPYNGRMYMVIPLRELYAKLVQFSEEGEEEEKDVEEEAYERWDVDSLLS